MSITSKSGEIITKEQASKYTHLFQKQNPEAINSYFVGTDRLREILKQEGCMGMRIYPGKNDQTNKTNLVLVGVDQKGNDMVEGVILEELITCPPICRKESSLLIKE